MYDEKTRQRFWSKIDIRGENDCWEWRAGKTIYGYGTFWCANANHQSPRIAYELVHGEIPDGLFVCHSCDNRLCCNPKHLWIGTNQENTLDRVVKHRSAAGQSHGSVLHPERVPRGERSGRYTLPERTARGEQVGTAKMSESDVREIRNLYKQGMSLGKIAKHKGMGKSQIHRIVHRIWWKHIPDD